MIQPLKPLEPRRKIQQTHSSAFEDIVKRDNLHRTENVAQAKKVLTGRRETTRMCGWTSQRL